MTDTSPEDWIISFSYDPSNLTRLGAYDWPWGQANVTEILQTVLCYQYMQFTISPLSPIIILVLTSLGLMASVLSLWSFWRKAIVKRKHFYIGMFLISIFDFLYCVMALMVNISGGEKARHSLQSSGIILEIIQLGQGIQYSISLAADFLALGLTIYRFLAICQASTIMTMSQMKLICILVAGSILSLICVLGRFVRYGFQNTIVPIPQSLDSFDSNRTLFALAPSPLAESDFFPGLVEFVDFILPLAMLVPMFYFAIRIAFTVEKRRKSQIVDRMYAERREEIENRSRSMLRLLSILIILFIINQLGYCLYAVVCLRDEKFTMTFNNTGQELVNICQSRTFVTITGLFADTAECLDRSLNFFLYLLLSPPTRKQCKKAVKRMFNAVRTMKLSGTY